MVSRFTVEVDKEIYNVIKVFEGTDYYLYVLPNNVSKNGFFLAKNNNSSWQLANKVLVSNDIIAIEAELIEKITSFLQKEQ